MLPHPPASPPTSKRKHIIAVWQSSMQHQQQHYKWKAAYGMCRGKAETALRDCRACVKAVLEIQLDQIKDIQQKLYPVRGGREDGQVWSDAYKEDTDKDALSFFLKTLDKFNPGKTDKYTKALQKARPFEATASQSNAQHYCPQQLA